tara:strand:- start:1176 stop:2264 length:1089 start_codon:yes stop_codon:yes gene_type:complete
MSGETNKLVKKSQSLSNEFDNSEYDVLVSSGEQIACALIAGRLRHLGYKSQSWMGWQIPILTDENHSSGRIIKINKKKIIKYLKTGGTPIVTGFQGINLNQRITTLGRGGSDASAIMFAKFFNAKKCVIFTDVVGVMTTDPRIYNKAKKIKVISYEEMLEMASLGSKVMQSSSIQDARLNRINVHVKSSFVKKKGTIITKRKNIINHKIITGISSTKNDAKVTLVGVKDKPGIAASIFKPLSQNYINVDMVVQNISADGNETDLTFTIKSEDLWKTQKLIKQNNKINYKKLIVDKNVSKVSIIGVGMITTPGVTYRMFQVLGEKKINILVISTSEIKISVLINKKHVKKAISALHKEFKLNK